MLNILSIFCLIYAVSRCECANILGVFPTPSISHQVVYRSLMHELVKRGHHVTMITADPAFSKEHSPHNLTEIDVHDLSYTMWNKFVVNDKGKESESQSQLHFILKLMNAIFEKQIESDEVQKLINNRKRTFDLLFVEACLRPTISFSYIYKVPVIGITSIGPLYQTFDYTGTPINPLVYPIITRQKLNNLTLWEKIMELYTQYKYERLYAELENLENMMLKKLFGRYIPDINELKKNVDMLFMDVHHIWDSNRPVPPNVIYLGGLHRKPEKPLPEDLKSFLDYSKNGVIYMSFGTNVKPSLLPPEKIQIFTKVFSQLSYDVLWKWDSNKIPKCSKNVRTFNWFPQYDLLKHPNVKLFITQGGLQSTDEAINAGVPMIGIPMLADQWYNVEMYIKYNIGLKLNIETITEDKLKDAIETVINNKNYRKNVIKLRNVIYDQPQSSLERAVWWTEHVLRHGGAAHLRTPAAHMHWTEYYALNLVLLFLSLFIIFLTLVGFVMYFLALKLKYSKYFKVKKH